MTLAGKKVLVVGLARTGIAAARFCAARGARVTVTDRKPEAALAPALAALEGLAVTGALGGHDAALFLAQDLIVLSPGVPLATPELQAAARAGVPILAEVELAARFLAAPIVAVTGTNGKSTTVSLIADVGTRAGKRTFAGGNLGTPLLDAVDGGYSLVVAELSSFQLETTSTLAPEVAMVLNVTPDHLDRYLSMSAYAAAKERIFAAQRPTQHVLLNADDGYAAAMAGRVRSRPTLYSSKRALASGAFLDGESIVLRLGESEERFDARGRRLLGHHNLENLLVMAATARLLGLPRAAVEGTIASFAGLPHRLELVRTHRGVRYYNDSKATNVDSVLRSLESVSGRIRLIAGGRHKGSPYAPLRSLIAERVTALYTIGEAAPLLAAELGDVTTLVPCGDLAPAVARAAAEARPGDAVLLSPACASYDQFTNYEERGDRFRALVEALS